MTHDDGTNLYAETVATLEDHKLTSKDVLWVGSKNGKLAMSWGRFVPIAKATNYDRGYGSQKIACDLVVVFTGGRWLSRAEYDGSEWWTFNECPTTTGGKPFKQVTRRGGMWENLEETNEEEQL